MNSNTLMEELYIILRTSGWLDATTKYFQEHPEKFIDSYSRGKIANLDMSVSYQPESLSAVADVEPNVFISMGHVAIDAREYNVYSDGSITSRTWINNSMVAEVRS